MTEKRDTFFKKVMTALKGGEEKHVKRFHKEVLKHINTQITIRKSEIADIKEKMSDNQDEYDDSILNIDLDSIKTIGDIKGTKGTNGSDGYMHSYVSNMLEFKVCEQELLESIETKEEEIKHYEGLLEDLK